MEQVDLAAAQSAFQDRIVSALVYDFCSCFSFRFYWLKQKTRD
jgi:hypothetical protein